MEAVILIINALVSDSKTCSQVKEKSSEGWRDVSVVRTPGCFSKGPEFDAQEPQCIIFLYSIDCAVNVSC